MLYLGFETSVQRSHSAEGCLRSCVTTDGGLLRLVELRLIQNPSRYMGTALIYPSLMVWVLAGVRLYFAAERQTLSTASRASAAAMQQDCR